MSGVSTQDRAAELLAELNGAFFALVTELERERKANEVLRSVIKDLLQTGEAR